MMLRDTLRGLNWMAMAIIVLLSVLLGIANNFRVYEEQRIVFLPDPEEER